MERYSLITQEQLDTLEQARQVLLDVTRQAACIKRQLPEGSRIAWQHEVGVDGAVIRHIERELGNLTSQLVQTEQSFDVVSES